MAFKRTSAKSLINNNTARFSTAYKFSKKANFEVGKDAYIIPLGLETGFYETPCHRVLPHKVNGQMVGFNNSTFATYIKCKGIDEEGNRTDSLCCQLAQAEKTRIPEKELAGKRIVSFTTFRVQLPVLILSNSLADKNKATYPVSKVSILNDLRSEQGLNFAYIDMSSSTFKSDIISAFGKKLKEDGVLDYEMDENSEEFFDEIIKRLSKTIIKVHGVSKTGFNAALKEYSFFPFDNPAIATGSPEGEREAIIGYKDNQEIQNKICEFLDLFNVEVDNMFTDWNEKDLQEYYNSAVGNDIKAPIQATTNEEEPEEVVEVVEEPEATEKPVKKVKKVAAPVVEEVNEEEEAEVKLSEPISDEDLKQLVGVGAKTSNDSLDEFEFDTEDDDDFFSED